MIVSDWQRQKVYDAEAAFKHAYLSKDHLLRRSLGFDIEQIRAMCNEVFEAIHERYGYETRVTDIRQSRGRSTIAVAYRSTGKLAFSPQYVTPLTVIHEACHLATDDHVPGHGIEFAENMLIAVEAMFGTKERNHLQDVFDSRGVHYSYEMRQAYTTKRARWACGQDGARVSVTLTRHRSLGGTQPRFMFTKGLRDDEGILLPNVATAGVGLGGNPDADDLLIPYGNIAYIKREMLI